MISTDATELLSSESLIHELLLSVHLVMGSPIHILRIDGPKSYAETKRLSVAT